MLEADMALPAHFDAVTGERLAREALHLARAIAGTGVEAVALAMLGCALVAPGRALCPRCRRARTSATSPARVAVASKTVS
ncbi:hypothetical protein [Amycolatopsis methanolica]|uniref:Uncharacterized protein n=1 Tax=Amycolatopsis methanolica 239 TaxID=1068978 RepID=A0A076MSK5_AMYME|nr:hypothetical protein [Amycolatopsis methanolica]AIJ23888.1 hypothetical protein AMETH_3796 [Amycolatopsis methanolica 239]